MDKQLVVSATAFEELALNDVDGQWELWDGEARQKPSMTAEHNWLMAYLGAQLINQIDLEQFQVRINAGHVTRTTHNYFIPDVAVLPLSLVQPFRGRADVLEAYREPLPLVVEVWSPSTGGYDQRVKLAEYQRRGDAEIWLLHPYERTLTAWRRGPDGTYTETVYRTGSVQPAALPGVSIDLEALFNA